MSTTYVPILGSGVAVLLPHLHLPRLWLKVSLEAQGKLAAGYPGIGKGFDAMTCAALGLDEAAVKSYIAASKPTYPQFVAWVKLQGKKVGDSAALAKHNSDVTGYLHDPEERLRILGANGLPIDDTMPKDAVNLNALDDMLEFHEAVLK